MISQYGTKVQYATDDDKSSPLSKEETKYVQAVAGMLLYYARAVDPTILTALSAIATKQTKPMQETKKGKTIVRLLRSTEGRNDNI